MRTGLSRLNSIEPCDPGQECTPGFMKSTALSIFIIAILLSSGCSGEGEEPVQGHVWQEQTDVLDKANAVEDELLQSAEQQQLLLEQQTR